MSHLVLQLWCEKPGDPGMVALKGPPVVVLTNAQARELAALGPVVRQRVGAHRRSAARVPFTAPALTQGSQCCHLQLAVGI